VKPKNRQEASIFATLTTFRSIGRRLENKAGQHVPLLTFFIAFSRAIRIKSGALPTKTNARPRLKMAPFAQQRGQFAVKTASRGASLAGVAPAQFADAYLGVEQRSPDDDEVKSAATHSHSHFWQSTSHSFGRALSASALRRRGGTESGVEWSGVVTLTLRGEIGRHARPLLKGWRTLLARRMRQKREVKYATSEVHSSLLPPAASIERPRSLSASRPWRNSRLSRRSDGFLSLILKCASLFFSTRKREREGISRRQRQRAVSKFFLPSLKLAFFLLLFIFREIQFFSCVLPLGRLRRRLNHRPDAHWAVHRYLPANDDERPKKGSGNYTG